MQKFYRINEICIQHLLGIYNDLSLIETKGESTMKMYKIRTTLEGVLFEMREDNKQEIKDNLNIDIHSNHNHNHIGE